jgi:uncharacterized protein YecE (DUF72 family)
MNIKSIIGCSGWHYTNWKGNFYPERFPTSKFLSYYAQHFNSVEVNNTFYQYPSLNTINNWYQNTPADFIFSLKVNKQITHIKRLNDIDDELNDFYQYGTALKEKMGYYLFQFPKAFTFSEEHLSRILTALNPTYRNVVEFRDKSWWNPRVFKEFEEANIVFCTVSGFWVPDELITINSKAYIRFHGDPTYSSSYSAHELSCWKDSISNACVQECWAYFNNTAHGHAIKNAKLLLELFNK